DLDIPWSQVWQSYLLEQLNIGPAISYQEVVLLWAMLFPAPLQSLADTILKHYMTAGDMRQKHAERFIASLSLDLRDLRDLNYSIYSRDMRNIRNIKHLRHLKELIYLRNISDLRELTSLEDWRN